MLIAEIFAAKKSNRASARWQSFGTIGEEETRRRCTYIQETKEKHNVTNRKKDENGKNAGKNSGICHFLARLTAL